MTGPVSANNVAESVSTSSAAAVTAISAATVAGKVYAWAFFYNPTGSGAGVISADNFQQHNQTIPAGPSLTQIPAGLFSQGIQVKRSGGTNISGGVLFLG